MSKAEKKKKNSQSGTQTALDWQSSKTLDVNAVRENYLNWFILKVPRARLQPKRLFVSHFIQF